MGLSKSICSKFSYLANALAKVLLPLLGLPINNIYNGGLLA